MRLKAEGRLIVALDFPGLAEAERMMDRLAGVVSYFKIGFQLFTAAGPGAVEAVKRRDAKVFLDLKYHDIPNTVASAVSSAAGLGVDMVNLHASGGRAMMAAAAAAASKSSHRPLLLAVTALTSLDGRGLEEITGLAGLSVEQHVVRLATLARESGLDGAVASPREILPIRNKLGRDFVVLTPGIRPSGSPDDDQARKATPAEAVAMGADYIVVGRPVTRAADPLKAAREIIEEMSDALERRHT